MSNHHAKIDCILQVLRERCRDGMGTIHRRDLELLEGEIQRLRRLDAALEVLEARGRIPPKYIDPIDPGFFPPGGVIRMGEP